MTRSYEFMESRALGRRMELLWFGEAGYPYLCFPTSMGRFYQYEDFGLVAALADRVASGAFQLVCVDSVDGESWYDQTKTPAERALRHDAYDRYLRRELTPYVQHRAGRNDLGVFGCSFGGYHAANFAGRYPEVATKAVCLSGIYDVHRWVDPYWDELCYMHSPADYVPNMDEQWVRRLAGVDWTIATGEYDSLAENNRAFAAFLEAKGVPRRAEMWEGVFGHDWSFWNQNAVRFL